MPAYSVVKDLRVRIVRTALLPAGRSLAFFKKRSETIKNPASSAGPTRPHILGRVRAMLDWLLTCVRNRPHSRQILVPESPIAPDTNLPLDTKRFVNRNESISESFISSSPALHYREKPVNFSALLPVINNRDSFPAGSTKMRPSYFWMAPYFLTMPQAIRSPAFPAGSVF